MRCGNQETARLKVRRSTTRSQLQCSFISMPPIVATLNTPLFMASFQATAPAPISKRESEGARRTAPAPGLRPGLVRQLSGVTGIDRPVRQLILHVAQQVPLHDVVVLDGHL